MTYATRRFDLFEWQQRAVDAWVAGDGSGECRGTLEVFTGGGKTLIALACAERAGERSSDLRVAVVVPTEALAHQWKVAIAAHTNVDQADIGLLGAGGSDELGRKRVLVAVLNSAARYLPEMARATDGDTMLIVDECHRAGAPTFSRVLDTPARFRLGLSATPDREELDDDGEPLEYDEQLVGRALGGVVYRFSLREARLANWLPEFTVTHHGVHLLEAERFEYDKVSRQVDDLGDRIRENGADASRARSLLSRPGELGQLAAAYVRATAKRKDLLYRANERGRVTESLLLDVVQRRDAARVLLFHERIDEAIDLRSRLEQGLRREVGIEHSRLPASERRRSLDRFRDGSLNVLVSVKSLIEGIDVPSADVGVSVASSSSVRQRIQSLGRVLRRTFDASDKTAEMHVLYVADTVDEVIYTKEDWSDLTGSAANTYWTWPAGAVAPEGVEGPPRTPAATEEQEWERLGGVVPGSPEPWLGSQPDREYSVDTSGTVRNSAGALIANSQGVAAMLEVVRGRPGGRFFVTPVHRLVLIREGKQGGRLLVAGRLSEPFTSRDEAGADEAVDLVSSTPGQPYSGPIDKTNGEYRLSQKRGGVIQRDLTGGIKEFALTHDPRSDLVANAERVLAAWRSVASSGLKIAINARWHAWYLEGGTPRFLATVPGGFAWPSDGEGET